MTSGNPARPVNAVSPMARANCQLRYIAGTNYTNALTALRRHLDDRGFANVTIEDPPDENRGGYLASRTEPDNGWVTRIAASMGKTTGQKPVIIPQMGGSICNDLFTDLLGLPAIWIPHSYSGCSQHAPNEHILMPVCREALQIMTALYWDLGEEQVD
jgi:acetylornithine deacetylase/succinyl-diaminopimelate desuccinylase-like protein